MGGKQLSQENIAAFYLNNPNTPSDITSLVSHGMQGLVRKTCIYYIN